MEQNFFNKNNFNVVKEAITSEMAFFLNKYFHNDLIEFPWADTIIFLSNLGSIFFL